MGRPWGGFWEENLETEKTSEKKGVKEIASAGDACPGKEGFRVAKGQVGRIQDAFTHPSDGRADSMCCAQTAAPEEVRTARRKKRSHGK